jgi:hypothetical protein
VSLLLHVSLHLHVSHLLKLDGPYIHRCLVKTDEYKFIFIGFGTDEYNLNIFIGTDEFKNPNE